MTKKKSKTETSGLTTLEVEESHNDIQELKTLMLRMQEELNESILKSSEGIRKSLAKIEEDLLTKITEQNKIIEQQNIALESQNEKILNLEIKLYDNNQYTRRNNIEFSGISKNIEDDDLEEEIIQQCKKVVKLSSRDIEACHWLNKKKTQAVVRFVNRKNCTKILRNRKKFLGKHIYVNENLCPYYRFLWFKCRLLHKKGQIHSYWTYNGQIRTLINEADDNFIIIQHMSQLKDLFPNFNFDEKLSSTASN